MFRWTFISGLITSLLLLAYPCSAAWQIEVVDPSGEVGAFCSLALSAAEQPRIAYYSYSEYRLMYTRRDGGSWSRETVSPVPSEGEYCSLAIGSDDRPRIAYWSAAEDTLRFAEHDGTAWDLSTVDATVGAGQDCHLVLDILDRPHISYNNRFMNVLRYATHPGATWQLEALGVGGYSTSLALDSYGLPHITSYWPQTVFQGQLYYRHHDGSSWQTETPGTDAQTGFHSSLAMNSLDQPQIAHFEGSSESLRFLLKNQWDLWEEQIADPGPHVGHRPRLALDSSDRPHISYHDLGYGRLLYAFWDGSDWQREIVDEDGVMGSYSSLALDSLDRPHIAYYDSGRRELRYARWDPPPAPAWYDVAMADTDLHPGKQLLFSVQGGNPTASPIPVDEYILLEWAGQFWFWPSWTQAVEATTWTMGSGLEFDVPILDLTWPTGLGSGSGLWFHGGIAGQGTADLIDYGSVSWSYSE